MKTFTTILTGAALALTAFAPAAAETRAEKGEAELAKILEGRVAGEPVRCINQHRSRNLEIIDETALVYRDGDTIYVSRPAHPASLDDMDILLIEKWGTSRLCSNDHIKMLDRGSGFVSGIVFLEDFVPYTKAG